MPTNSLLRPTEAIYTLAGVSRSAGREVPEAVRSLLGGARLEDAVGLTVLLLTVDEEGWPRIAMLSAGEVLATGPRSLRVALWPHSSSTANLLRSPHATLALVHGGAGWYLRCRVTGGHELA